MILRHMYFDVCLEVEEKKGYRKITIYPIHYTQNTKKRVKDTKYLRLLII
jgi:hypothetical protein